MFRFPIRAAALSCLALSACDSATPETASIVGTWQMEEHIQETIVTSNRDQEIIDVNQPGTGEIAFGGAATGSLRYAGIYTDPGRGTTITLFSTDYHTHPFPARYSSLSLAPEQTTLTVWRDGTYRQFSLFHYNGEATYTRAGNRLTVPQTTLTTSDGETVTVGGTLSLPVHQIRAGVDKTVERQRVTDEDDRRITFDTDGTYRDERRGERPETYTGAWEQAGDGRIRIRYGGGTVNELTYSVEDGRLSLTGSSESCRDDANRGCRGITEQLFGLAPGSVQTVRVDITGVFRADAR